MLLEVTKKADSELKSCKKGPRTEGQEDEKQEQAPVREAGRRYWVVLGCLTLFIGIKLSHFERSFAQLKVKCPVWTLLEGSLEAWNAKTC